jgi:hypothetical protein
VWESAAWLQQLASWRELKRCSPSTSVAKNMRQIVFRLSGDDLMSWPRQGDEVSDDLIFIFMYIMHTVLRQVKWISTHQIHLCASFIQSLKSEWDWILAISFDVHFSTDVIAKRKNWFFVLHSFVYSISLCLLRALLITAKLRQKLRVALFSLEHDDKKNNWNCSSRRSKPVLCLFVPNITS